MSTTFVLIPGAWQGGWVWQPVAERLRAAGHDAYTITSPGLAGGDVRAGLHLSDAVEHLIAAIEKPDLRDVVLVAHSWGGYLVAGAAPRVADRLNGIVLFNAMVPRAGVSVADESDVMGPQIRAAVEATPDGTIPLVPEYLPALLPESGAELRSFFAGLTVPMPGGYFTEALNAVDLAGLDVPMHYLLSDNDQVLIRPGAEFAARVGLVPQPVGRGHQSMVTHPAEVADAILRVIRV